MYYDELGSRDKPTIVFLHCAAIVEIYLKLYALADRFHIIVPHLYGSGKEISSEFNFLKNETDVADLIKSLNKPPVFIVGHSEGANLALALISHYPSLFEKAIISSPMIDKTDRIAKNKAAYVGFFYPLIKSKLMGRIYVKFLEIEDDKQKEFFMDYWTKISKNTWKQYYTDRFTIEKYPEILNTTVPILFLHGSKEPRVIDETVKTLIKISPNNKEIVVEGFGHEHPLKNADGFKLNILSWFS